MNTSWLEVLVIVALGVVMLLWAHQRQRVRRLPDLWLRRSANSLECEVIPRRDATPAEFKRLAEALERWIGRHAVVSMTTAYALADLHEGELPQPLSVALEHYLDDNLVQRGQTPPSGAARAERHRQILQTLGEMATRRTVYVRVQDARQAADSLRQSVPAELVEDILINNRSWDDPA
jgi:hypothetical protein